MELVDVSVFVADGEQISYSGIIEVTIMPWEVGVGIMTVGDGSEKV